MLSRTAKACGPDTPTLVSSEQNGLLVTGARQPGSRGERAISCKTIAQGMPGDPAEPVVTAACVFLLQAGHGRGLRPAFPAPSSNFEGDTKQDSDAIAPREGGCASLLSETGVP